MKEEEKIIALKDVQNKVRETPIFNKPYSFKPDAPVAPKTPFKPDAIQNAVENKSGSKSGDTIEIAAKALQEADEAMNQAR